MTADREAIQKLHRRVQQAEAVAERKVADLQSQLDRIAHLQATAKAWADEHLEADWTTDASATWWRYTSENNRHLLTHLFSELKRLRKAETP